MPDINDRPVSLDERRLAIEERRLDLEERKVSIEQARLEYRPKELNYEAHSKTHIASWESVIKFAEMTIRSLLILNGGAAIAVLTFAGNAAKSASEVFLANSVVYFGIGAALSVVTAGLAYLAQFLFTNLFERTGRAFQYAAIAATVGSLLAFGCGMKAASDSLERRPVKEQSVTPKQ